MSSASETAQFGSFDGLDNRKTVLDLFKRMGHGLTESEAAAARAGFLQGLVHSRSTTCFAMLPIFVSPCSVTEAYHLFVAITGVLGVPIDEGARLLEEVVRLM